MIIADAKRRKINTYPFSKILLIFLFIAVVLSIIRYIHDNISGIQTSKPTILVLIFERKNCNQKAHKNVKRNLFKP